MCQCWQQHHSFSGSFAALYFSHNVYKQLALSLERQEILGFLKIMFTSLLHMPSSELELSGLKLRLKYNTLCPLPSLQDF